MSAPEMFQLAQNRNNMLTLAIRVGGFVMLGIAFSMILRPIAVLASILPFLGRLVGTGTTIIAFLLAAIVWTLTVADSVGGLDGLIRRSEQNLALFEGFVASHPWIRFLAKDKASRSNTSVCLSLDLKIGRASCRERV